MPTTRAVLLLAHAAKELHMLRDAARCRSLLLAAFCKQSRLHAQEIGVFLRACDKEQSACAPSPRASSVPARRYCLILPER